MRRIQDRLILKPTPTFYIQNESDQCQAFKEEKDPGGQKNLSEFNMFCTLECY